MLNALPILYNLLLWNISFYVSYKYYKRYSIGGIRDGSNKSQYKFVFVLMMLYSLFTFFGGDAIRYKEFVEGGYHDAYFYDNYGYEKIYVFLASISSKSIIIWKLFVYGTAIASTAYAMKVAKCDNFPVLLSAVLCIFVSYGSTRGVMAYSIYLLGFVIFNVEKRLIYKIIGICLILSSYFAHTSMILPILLFPLLKIELTNFRVFLLICLSPFIITLINNIPNLIESLLGGGDSMILYKYNTYSNENKEAYNAYRSFLTRIYEVLELLFILILCFFSVKSNLKYDHNKLFKRIVTLSFALVYIGLIFKMSNMFASQIMYQRYFTMVPFFIYFIIPYMAKQDGKNLWIPKIIIFCGFIKTNFMFVMEMYYATFR